MSSPNLAIVSKKVEALDTDLRLYYQRIISNVESLRAFHDRENLAYLILAHCVDILPPEMTSAIPAQTFTSLLARFLHDNEAEHSRRLYSTEFLMDTKQVAKDIAAGFEAIIAEDLLQQYALGDMKIDEPESYAFRWPYYSQTDFPYEDRSEAETAEEAEILDRLEATLAKIQEEKGKG